MRLLKVKQPWASMIAHGDKEIEVRSRNTNIREKIAIYATKTPPSSKDMDHVRKFFEFDLDRPLPNYLQNMPIGRILATATISKSIPFTQKEWKEEQHSKNMKIKNVTARMTSLFLISIKEGQE